MDKNRQTAFLALKQIEEKKTWSNLALSKNIDVQKPDSPAFVRELVYGVLRNIYLLDYNIDSFLKKPKIGVSERIWLRMGFYQLSLMDGVASYAAINETVELARKYKKGCEGFINAVLRNFQRSGCVLKYRDESLEERLSIQYSAHKDIVELWLSAYGEEQTEEMLKASLYPAPLVIRANSLKISRAELKAKLEDLGFETKDCILSKDGLKLKGSELLSTRLFEEGYFSVEGESSQYAVEVLSPAPGSTVIDLCAAPGGKTCAMAQLMQNKGKLLAFDYYEHRVKLIEKEVKRLGIDIVECAQKDSSVFDETLVGTADFVLCDVPCSGLGTLRQNPEIKYRTPDRIDVQKAILENALKYLKPGGYVLYSTCTVDPKENQDITRGLNIVEEHQLFTEINGQDGFYICKIKA